MFLFRISEQSAAFKENNRINQSIHLLMYLSLNQSNHLSINQPINNLSIKLNYLSMYLGFLNKVLLLKRIIESINLSINVSISQSIYLSSYPSIYLSIYLGFLNKVLLLKRIIESINQSTNLSIYQSNKSFYLLIYLTKLSTYLFI